MIEANFLFWLFLIGIIIAVFQDLKRREVDNWLNLFLLLASFSYIFYKAIFENNLSIIFLAGFILAIMFLIMNLFYYSRIFGGGDACLLFAMSVFFVESNFIESIMSIWTFILLLMISGSVYGIIYSLVLYSKNFQYINKDIRKNFNKFKNLFILFIAIGFFLLIVNFSLIFVLFSLLIIIFPFLYVFARSLENISMVRVVSGKELREGDWLAKDEKIGNRIIKYHWEGLSKEDIKLLSKKKRVKIKEGIPFVPVFLIAFVFYFFIRGYHFLVNFILGFLALL